MPLDGKKSVTCYQPLSYDSEATPPWWTIDLQTGRYHQIRRHFE